MVETKKGLYIISTPIGNLEDITFRALNILKNSDIIVCENPKHSVKLLNKFGIKKKLFSLHDYNEINTIKKLEKHSNSSVIALISDAGSPLVSDPGYKLLRQCIKDNIFVTTVPGASSIISALQLSGLPVNDFVFVGFAPKSKKKLFDFLKPITSEKRTVVVFVSSHKIAQTLTTLSEVLPDRKISVCKEITKLNEKVFYGFPKKVLNAILSNKKYSLGEFVVVVEGEKNNSKIDKKNISSDTKKIIKRLLEKFSLTETVEIVHKISYIEKKHIYKKALEIKDENNK